MVAADGAEDEGGRQAAMAYNAEHLVATDQKHAWTQKHKDILGNPDAKPGPPLKHNSSLTTLHN